jgi:uncharacterized protein YndB with AHSA1/START domain
MPVKSKTNELRLTRIYDAPVNLVWDAWTDPEQTAQWWGPRGFTLTTHSKDLRPGGIWHYTMHGPDGVDYPSKTVYLEVEKHAKLVYDHGGCDDKPPMFRVTVLFTAVDGKTKMDMCMTLPTPEAAEETRKFIKSAGGDATWDRLAEYLEKESSGKDQFVINRSFNAPIELMFDMWTDPKHFSQWIAPTGFRTEFIRADIKPGGSSFYFMANESGMKMYGRAEYLKVSRPNLLIYQQQFCDENEKISRHPMMPTFPATMVTTVQFNAEAPDQTRVTVTWECGEDSTAEERETFLKARSGMTMGWTGSFDKLEEYASKVC